MTVSFVDVDDETAAAMVLADNKLAELGGYDDMYLAELFKDLPSELVDVTGWEEQEIDDILKDIDLESIEEPPSESLGR